MVQNHLECKLKVLYKILNHSILIYKPSKAFLIYIQSCKSLIREILLKKVDKCA